MTTEGNGYIDYSIDRLFTEQIIDVRTRNVLRAYNLEMLQEVYEYYLQYGDFLRLRNLGEKCNHRLVNFLRSIADQLLIPEKIVFQHEDDSKSRITENIDPDIMLTNFSQYHSLSSRAKNILGSFEIETVKDFFEFYLTYGSFLKIRNCGINTNQELIDFVIELQSNVDQFKTGSAENYVSKECYRFMADIAERFRIHIDKNAAASVQFKENRLEIFSLLDFIAKNYLSLKRYTIFQQIYARHHYGESKILNKLSSELDITRQRGQQIFHQLPRKFFNKFPLFVKDHIPYENIKKYFDTTQDLIRIDDVLSKKIEQSEHVTYGTHIIAPIMKSVYRQQYSLFEIDMDVPKHYYLITKDIFERFDIQSFFDDFLDLYHLKKEWHQTIELQPLIVKHSFRESEHLYERIKTICDTVITQITGLSLNHEGNYIRKPEKIRKKNLLIEFMREHAEELMSSQTIFDELNKKYPGLYKNVDRVRGIMHPLKNIKCLGKKGMFIYYDNPETDDIPFENSLGKMVIHYLEKKDYPVHIYELKQYIDSFFEINLHSIVENLRISACRYNFTVNKNFYSLKGKEYKQESKNFNKISFGLLRKIKDRTGQLLYSDIPVIPKLNVDRQIKSGEYILDEKGALLYNSDYNKFIEYLAREFKLETIQVLSVIEPEIKKGTFYIDNKNRLRLSAKAVSK